MKKWMNQKENLKPKRVLTIFLAAAAAALTFWAAPAVKAGTSPDQPGVPAHYIVFNRATDGSVTPVFYKQVRLSTPLQSLGDNQVDRRLTQADRDHDQFMVSLQSTSGQRVFQTVVEVPRWLRGEFHTQGPDGGLSGAIDGHIFPLESTSFVVRVPILAGTDLVIQDESDIAGTRFNLAQLAADTPEIQFNPRESGAEPNTPSGDPANRVDLLIMGDGYTTAEAAKFANDAANTAASFLGVSPLQEYANYVNVHTLFTASAESGTDHPPYDPSCVYTDKSCCADEDMLDDPLAGQMVDTAFDGTFCVSNIHRLLTVVTSKIYAAAAAVPDWDEIIVLVNDTTYGGSGGSLAVTSMHLSGVQIAQHEYGHSFVKLADEYDSPYPTYPACSDLGGSSPCEVNVTNQTSRELIKWAPWIEPTTPIPTPEDNSAYEGVVGLFEGARYQVTGMFRPGDYCVMRYLGYPWCQVPSQAYVLRLYQGGWGTPAGGISMIEPGTASPAQTGVSLQHPDSQTFQADLLEPVGGPAAAITWLVNGSPVAGETSPSFDYSTSSDELGTVTIELQVVDTTPLVHPDMDEGLLDFSYTWTIEVSGPENSIYLPVIQR